MRISDWSSDVCSSDLGRFHQGRPMLRNLIAYLDSVKARDPAPRSRAEILLYPGLWSLAFHRVAHRLYRARLYFRSEERRVGKECVSTGRYRGSLSHKKKNHRKSRHSRILPMKD